MKLSPGLIKLLSIDANYTRAMNGKGLALANLGKHEDAITWFDKALSIDGNYTNAMI